MAIFGILVIYIDDVDCTYQIVYFYDMAKTRRAICSSTTESQIQTCIAVTLTLILLNTRVKGTVSYGSGNSLPNGFNETNRGSICTIRLGFDIIPM